MLSNGFDATLHLRLRPSKILLTIRLLAHITALVAVSLPLHIYVELKAALYMFIILSIVRVVINYIKTRNRQRVFYWRNSNQWVEVNAEGDVVWLCQTGAMIMSWFMIVWLKNADAKESVFIGADQCDRETYRRLYVRLKYLSNPAQGMDANSTDSR